MRASIGFHLQSGGNATWRHRALLCGAGTMSASGQRRRPVPDLAVTKIIRNKVRPKKQAAQNSPLEWGPPGVKSGQRSRDRKEHIANIEQRWSKIPTRR